MSVDPLFRLLLVAADSEEVAAEALQVLHSNRIKARSAARVA